MTAVGEVIGRRLADQLTLRAGDNITLVSPRELRMPGEIVERHGVRIVGHRNVPSRLAADASALFARNLYNFLSAFWDKEAGKPVLPDDDEIVKALRVAPALEPVS